MRVGLAPQDRDSIGIDAGRHQGLDDGRRNLGNLRQPGTQDHDDAIARRGRLASGGYSSGCSSAAATATAGSASGTPWGMPHCSNGTPAANCKVTDESVP